MISKRGCAVLTFSATEIMDTLQIIKELAAKRSGAEVDTIDADVRIDTMGIDSLDFLEFMFDVEDRIGLAIPQDAVAQVTTFRELAAAIDAVIACGAPTAAG